MAALMLATPGALLPPAAARAQPSRTSPAGRTARDPAVLAEHAGARLARPAGRCSATRTSSTRRPAGRACRGCTASRTPTLIVAGDDDPSVPLRNARMLAARLPERARCTCVEGGGHLFLLDEPESAVAAIRDFLDATPLVIGSQPAGANFDRPTG